MKGFLYSLLCCVALSFMAISCTKVGAQDTPSVETTAEANLVNDNLVVDAELLRSPVIIKTVDEGIVQNDTGYVDLNVTVTSPQPNQSIGSWLLLNLSGLVTLILFIGEVIVRLTPTEKDNANLQWLKNILNFIFGNRKFGGGSFKA